MENDYVDINNNILSVTNIAIPAEEYAVALTGYTTLYGQECSFNATVTFYKERYEIKYVLDSDSNAYSKRTAVNDPRNVTTYAVEGKNIAIYDPTRGDYDYFLGWYEDANYTIPFNNDLKTNPRNVVLYAKWDVATYYDSIDETPFSTPAGRVVIDWSKETDTNLLNHTSRPVYDKRYNNIDISNSSTDVTFIGTTSQTFTNFRMFICSFADGQDLTLRFVNFNFVANESSSIGLYDDGGVDLTIDVVGECSIGSSVTGSILGSSGLQIKNVTFTGNGTMTMTAGNGANGSSAGAAGTDGGVAIYAETLVMNMRGTLNVTGGAGGNGVGGSNGSKGSPSYNGHSDRNATGGGANGGNGTDGTNGGNAGKGGYAYDISTLIINSGTLMATGGQSGNGGNGGNGGAGGQGQEAGGWGTTAGSGGKGGNGGNGGNTYIVAASDGSENIVENNGTLSRVDGAAGTAGKAGAGGAGGAKGMHCDNDNCGQWATSGSDGSNGSAGSAGKAGSTVTIP